MVVEYEIVIEKPFLEIKEFEKLKDKRVKITIEEKDDEEFFKELRKRNIKIDKSIDIDKLTDEATNALS